MTAHPIPATLDALKVPISGLTPYPANPRRSNLDVITESLQRHGQYRPIVVRAKTFEVLAGNHTLAAAVELGWSEIAATFIDCTDDEAARIVLVDNRSADLGTYDDTVLADLLASLGDDLAGTGFDADTLRDLLAQPDLDALAAEYGAPRDDDLWLTITLRVPPDLHRRFFDTLDAEAGDTHTERLAGLLDRVHDHVA